MSIARLSFADAGRLTLPRLLERRVQETPDALAVVDSSGSLQYGEWLQAAKGISAALRQHAGVVASDRLLMWLPNGDALSFVSVFHGGLDAGAVVVPVDDRLTAREILGLLVETTARAAIISPVVAAGLSPAGRQELGAPDWLSESRAGSAVLAPVENGRLLFEQAITIGPEVRTAASLDAPSHVRDADACAFLGLTSGSTGRPKGVMVGHGGTVQLAERMINAIFALPRGGRPVTSEDVIQSPIPCYLTTSIVNNLYPSVLAGCPLVYEGRRFDPDLSERRMLEVGTTIYNGAPAHYAMMCRLPVQPEITDAVQVEVMISAGSPMTRELYGNIRGRWPRTAVANWYALNETLTGQTINSGEELERDPSAVGRPVWPTQLKVVDDQGKEVEPGQEGDVFMQAEGQMLGYWGRDDLTAIDNGWINTGDRGCIDGNGLLRIVGRNKERINRGGFKFYPVEVEQVLDEHPLVVESAVIGAPHPELGQEVVAFVMLSGGGDGVEPDEASLRNFCRERIARHKVPSRVLKIATLPRGDYGKVQKTELLKQFMRMTLQDRQGAAGGFTQAGEREAASGSADTAVR